jgi:hypothetical protein
MQREFGPLERTCVLAYEVAPLNGVFCTHIQGPLTPEILREALDRVQRKHPVYALKGTIRDKTYGHGHFSATERPIPLRVIEKQADDDWHAVMEEELNTRVAWEPGPLIRVVFLRSALPDVPHEVIFIRHHVINDMRAGITLIRDTLSFCSDLMRGTAEPNVVTGAVLPTVDKLFPARCRGWRRLLGQVAFTAKMSYANYVIRPRRLPVDRFVMPEDRRTILIHREIAEEVSIALQRRCREEGTTVQGAMCAAKLLAVYDEMGASGPVVMRCASFVDLRKMLEPALPEDAVGLYNSGLYPEHRVAKDTRFWDLAREVKQKLQKSLERDEIFWSIFLAPYATRYLVRNKDFNSAAVGVTNVGRISIATEYGPLRLLGMHSSLSASGVSVGCISVLSTLNHRMYWNLMASEPTMSRARAEALADSAYANLLENLGPVGGPKKSVRVQSEALAMAST